MMIGLVILEVFYFLRVLKRKTGFLGFPLEMIAAFKFDILKDIYGYPPAATRGLLAVVCIIMILRAADIFYLYKNKDAANGLPVGLFISVTLIDLATFIGRFIY